MGKKVVFFSVLVMIFSLLGGCKTKDSTGQESKNIQDSTEAVSNDDSMNTDNNVITDTNADNSENNNTDNNTDSNNNLKEVSDTETGIKWEQNAITVYKPKSGGVWYPRMYALKNGTILCGFDTNEDGGRAVVKVVSSKDGGLTWGSAVLATDLPDYDCANANFIELDNGDIWLAYRANVQQGEEYYSSIRVNVSKDGGLTWSPLSVVAEEKGTGGVYEPQFGYIGDKIAVFYANDSLNVVRNGRQQNIEFKLWENDKWSEKKIASDGTKTFSRDGMPVWCQLEDGSYALVIESTSLSPKAEFIIQMKKSPDGLDWSDQLKNIYIPNKNGKKAGAPYIVRLKDGRVAVSFQTDEDATLNGDPYSKMKVMISTDSSADEFLPVSVPFDTPDGYCSNWNSLLCSENYLLAATSTNYPFGSILLKRGSLQ